MTAHTNCALLSVPTALPTDTHAIEKPQTPVAAATVAQTHIGPRRRRHRRREKLSLAQ